MSQDLTGNPVQVGLLNAPFFSTLAMASQTGKLTLDDGAVADPLQFFSLPKDPAPPYRMGAGRDPYALGPAVLILNSLTTPLTLASTYFLYDRHQDVFPQAQAEYPAHEHPAGTWTKQHVIPAARPYPCATRHPGPAMLGGFGLYRFSTTGSCAVRMALAFSRNADGSTPEIGIAIRAKLHAGAIGKPQPNPFITYYSAVTASLQTLQYSGFLPGFQAETMFPDPTKSFDDYDGPDNPSPHLYDVGPGKCPVTVWGSFIGQTLIVWVRDLSSNL